MWLIDNLFRNNFSVLDLGMFVIVIATNMVWYYSLPLLFLTSCLTVSYNARN